MENLTIEYGVTITLFEASGYTLIADRVNHPVKASVTAYGFGYTLSSITPAD